MSHRRTMTYVLTVGALSAPMLLAVTGGAAAADPAGETSATQPAGVRTDAGPVTLDAGPVEPATFDPATAVADVLGPAGDSPATRGPVTALVDGLVGPTGLLGGQGLVAGLVDGLLDGPLVHVGVEVSPQVNVGAIASTGNVSQTAAG